MPDVVDSKMKAALLYHPMDLKIEYVDVPKIGDDEVLIRVRNVGVCPSDVRSYEGVYKREMFPFGRESYGLSGHEWCGEITMVGENVSGFSVGDRVVPEIILPCGTCKLCRKGMTNLCRNKHNVSRGFAEYAKAPYSCLFRIPDNVSFIEAAFTEPVAVCLHANDIISPKPGETVLIVGGGPMGLINMQISKLSGADVVVSEVVEGRLRKAKELGADHVINPIIEDLPKMVADLTDGYGADAVVVATGNKAAIETAFNAVSAAGKIVFFGGTYPPANVELDPNLVHYGELLITGSYDHTPNHVERALKILSKKRIDVGKLISHTFTLDRLKEAFELVRSAAALKVQVTP
ncbi:MAG: zinc-dependent alcohol dehydrogenase [Nitrososphaeria archaeon]